MPLPLQNPKVNNLSTAVEIALQKTGVIEPIKEAAEALTNMGLGVPELANHLGNLVLTAKDSVKRGAIQDAFALHGIDLKSAESAKSAPTFVFNVQSSGETNINSLFAPNRD